MNKTSKSYLRLIAQETSNYYAGEANYYEDFQDEYLNTIESLNLADDLDYDYLTLETYAM